MPGSTAAAAGHPQRGSRAGAHRAGPPMAAPANATAAAPAGGADARLTPPPSYPLVVYGGELDGDLLAEEEVAVAAVAEPPAAAAVPDDAAWDDDADALWEDEVDGDMVADDEDGDAAGDASDVDALDDVVVVGPALASLGVDGRDAWGGACGGGARRRRHAGQSGKALAAPFKPPRSVRG